MYCRSTGLVEDSPSFRISYFEELVSSLRIFVPYPTSPKRTSFLKRRSRHYLAQDRIINIANRQQITNFVYVSGACFLEIKRHFENS
jgi:hypothetical protein